MASQLRTALAAAGVLTICVCMALMKGHHLLMTFAAAGIACGIWSWYQHSRQKKPAQMFEPRRSSRRTPSLVEDNNVYPFPTQWQQMSDASGT